MSRSGLSSHSTLAYFPLPTIFPTEGAARLDVEQHPALDLGLVGKACRNPTGRIDRADEPLMVAIAAAGSMDPETAPWPCRWMHVPPGTKVDPANEIGGRYRYAISRRERAVDLVLKAPDPSPPPQLFLHYGLARAL